MTPASGVTLSKSVVVLAVAAITLPAQSLPGMPTVSAKAAADGRIYVIGNVAGTTLPTTPGVFQPSPAPCGATPESCNHGYVAQLRPPGERFEWASYLTATAPDSAMALAIAADGSLYVAGASSGAQRLFLMRIAPDGKSVLASTAFGGSGVDTIAKIVIDATGDIFIAGTTTSTDFPTTPGAYQRTPGANSTPVSACEGNSDQFVAKFDPGLKLVFSTLIGTADQEQTNDFAVGPDGSVVLAGVRPPVRNNPCTLAIFRRLNPQGSALIYSRSLANTALYSVAVDGAGMAYFGADNRAFGLSPPAAAIFRVEPQGQIVSRQSLNGHTNALAIVDGELGVLGRATVDNLEPLHGPAPCKIRFLPALDWTFYFARLNLATLQPTYVGYLTSDGAWMAAPDRLVATNPYGTLAPFALLPAGPPAPGTVTCVANAASLDTYVVSPGALVSLFGERIGPPAPAIGQIDGTGNLASELAGVRLLVDGLPSPILYAASGQINVVMPFAISGETVHFELYRDGILLSRFQKWLTPWNPGAFASGTPVFGPLAALNQDGSVNSDTNPAAPGSIVTIFATGLGAMSPQLPDGAVAPMPVNKPVQPVEIQVNGAVAETLYIGNAPTLAQGVVQINFRIPKSLSAAVGAQAGRPYVVFAVPVPHTVALFTAGTIAVR